MQGLDDYLELFYFKISTVLNDRIAYNYTQIFSRIVKYGLQIHIFFYSSKQNKD